MGQAGSREADWNRPRALPKKLFRGCHHSRLYRIHFGVGDNSPEVLVLGTNRS